MLRALLLAFILCGLALARPADAQSIDGTWLLFSAADDPALAQAAAAGGRLPQEQIDGHRRIVFAGDTATVHAGEATVSMTITPSQADWGVDAQVSNLQGSAAPITFLRLELGEGDSGTLTTYTGQTPLERFAVLRVRPAG